MLVGSMHLEPGPFSIPQEVSTNIQENEVDTLIAVRLMEFVKKAYY
jgi:hypothetical protein